MTTTYDCPNCGANVRDDGLTDSVRCSFCGTHVVIPRARPASSRRALETERDQILARESEWETRIREAGKRGVEDFVVPPVGCCGIYFGLFVAGSLILSALGLKASRQYGTAVAAIAIGAALVGVVLIIWRREARRRERIVALERERTEGRTRDGERLREIDKELALRASSSPPAPPLQ